MENENITNAYFDLITGVGIILLEITALLVAGPVLAALPAIETIQAVGIAKIEGIEVSKKNY